MNILIVSNLYPPNVIGGTEQAVASLSELLAEKGHLVTVLTLGLGLTSDKTVEKQNDNLTVIRFRSRNISFVFEKSKLLRKLRRPLWHARNIYNPFIPPGLKSAIAETNADIIHFHAIAGIGYNCLKLAGDRGTPTVVTFHDFGFVCMNHAMYYKGIPCSHYHASCAFSRDIKVRYLRKIQTLCLSAPSEAILSAVCERIPLVPGLRRAVKNPLRFHSQPARTRLSGPAQYVYVGQLEEIKGIRFWLEAAHPVLEQSGARVSILGVGRQSEMLAGRYKNSPHVTFKGFVNQATVSEEIANADALVMPSVCQENSPVVVCHALSYGIPVVASRIGGIPELVTDRENGLLLAPGETAEWRGTFERLSKSRNELSELKAGAENLKDRFSPQRIADEMVALYRDTIALKKARKAVPAES